MSLRLVYLMGCLSITARAVLVSINQYRELILQMHNNVRRMEPAANMKQMSYDPYLEERAAAWSETCYFGHQQRGLGENLSYFSSTGRAVPPVTVIRQSIQMWHGEKNIWGYSTTCGAACHYTQLVWAQTSRVGCALSYCPVMQGAAFSTNSMYFVCFYSPAGNYYGQYPFIVGQRCSRCDPGEFCLNGLCATSEFKRKKRSTKSSSKQKRAHRRT
ncbi:hypothetical protein ACJMK2_040672 [Sinanodonta woodiana]|uniref:SCP domain-containing protein n=1 Tax=Sinanodonta woodiana TaxID=1069815 RepID=A0ABD3W2D0_SINWO